MCQEVDLQLKTSKSDLTNIKEKERHDYDGYKFICYN